MASLNTDMSPILHAAGPTGGPGAAVARSCGGPVRPGRGLLPWLRALSSPSGCASGFHALRRAGRRRLRFTLLEVIIAAAILAVAVAASVGIVGAARSRILRAESRWGRQHLLSQAAEFYLLCGPNAPYPGGLLPEGFSASCSIGVVDDLPEDALEPQEGWVLGRFYIRVYDTAGTPMAECTVEKLLREEDCE